MHLDTRQGFHAYWIEGTKLAAGLPLGFLREGPNKVQWQGESGDLIVGGRALDGAGDVQLVNQQRVGVGIYATSTEFSRAGCWQLTATMGAGSVEAIVYVFPRTP